LVRIQISSFKGIAPKINSRYLPDGMAKECVDAEAIGNSLKPLRDTGSVPVGIPATIGNQTQTMYLYNAQGQAKQWLSWNTPVDVVPSQIAGDTVEWTHFTSASGPRSTYAAIALTGPGPYPAASLPMGIRRPMQAISASPVGSPPDPEETEETPESRVYVATFVRKVAGLEAESEPSPPSNTVTVYVSTQTVSVILPSLPQQLETNEITHIRLYRSTSGIFLFAGEYSVSNAGIPVIDSLLAASLSNELPSLDWQAPPQALSGLVNLPNGGIAGFVGRDVYFAEPFRPFAWPEKYVQTLDYRVVGMAAMDTTLVVATEGNPYLLQGSDPGNVVVVKADLEQACVSKQSVIGAMGAVFYASPDGLVRIAPGGSGVVSDGVFSQAQWQALKPETMRAFQHEMQLILFYDLGSVKGALVYDLRTQNFFFSSIWAAAAFRDILTDNLYMRAVQSNQVRAYGKGNLLNAKYVSKTMTMPNITCFTSAQVEAESYPLTFRVHVDGAQLLERAVTSRNAFRLPVGPGRDWQVTVEGPHEVFAITLAQSMNEAVSSVSSSGGSGGGSGGGGGGGLPPPGGAG